MILRVAHLADSHFNESRRLQDTIDIHRAFLEQARAVDVQLIVHAGDLFERKSTPAERRAVVDFLRAADTVAPVVLLQGNHDAPGDLYPYQFINNISRVYILDRATMAPGSAAPVGFSTIPLVPIALPWFSKAHLAASLEASADSGQSTRATIAAARDLLTGLRAEARRVAQAGAIPILVGHVQVGGAETSTGQTLIGQTVNLAPQDLLDVGCAYAALGHIHKHQSWFDGRVAYAGSPLRQNFGEPEAKGWVLVTLDTDVPGWFVSAEFQELPARRIELLECDWSTPEAAAHLAAAGINREYFLLGTPCAIDRALVRFRYHIRSGDLHLVDEDAIRRVLEADGAADVKIEAVLVHEARQRAPEIVTARTVADKLVAYWDAQGVLEDDPRARARALDKLAALETPAEREVANAVS